MPLINFSGLASGIDSNALIDATSTARRAQKVTPKEDKISELTDTNDSLSELKTMLLELKDMARDFSSLYNGGIVKLGKSSDETIMTATASSSATNGTYSFTVNQLAKNATYSFQSTAGSYTSSSDVIASGMIGTDTIDVTIGNDDDEEIVSISVDNTTTLSDFVTEFNLESSTATASLINVGTSSSPDYRVVIVTNNEGLQEGEIQVTVGANITTANAFDDNSVSQAQNAEFTMTGIGTGGGDTIERSSNTVTDLIPGVTLSFENEGSATVTVSDDTAATAAVVQEFVDKYNEIVAFINSGNLVTRQEEGDEVDNIFSPLAKTSVDDGILSQIRSNFSASSYSSGDAVRIFADLGITTERDGTLLFDQEEFEDALSDEPESVRNILQNFGDVAGVTGGTIDQYTRFNGLIDIVVNGNKDLISDLNDQIARAEASILREEETLRQRFARLEGLIGQLQNQQAALSSALSSLGTG